MYWVYSGEWGEIWKELAIAYLLGNIHVFRPIELEANYEHISQDWYFYYTEIHSLAQNTAFVWSPLPGSNLGLETENFLDFFGSSKFFQENIKVYQMDHEIFPPYFF
jgi:hypothetical protein